jgi:quercetin dioxygenase-like cupin family protein
MSRPDRLSHLPLVVGFLAVAACVGGFVFVLSPSIGSAAAPQQRPVIQGPMEDLDLGNLSIRRFRFPAGSRLGWHTHNDGPQLLMMEEGTGRLQERGGPVIEMLPDEPYVTPAGVEHWHGGSPDEGGIQWNIYDGIGVPGSVTWGDPVTDEEYEAQPAR